MERVGAGKEQLESKDWIYTANHEVNCGCVINPKLMSLLSAVRTKLHLPGTFMVSTMMGKNGVLVKTDDHCSCNHNKLVRK